MTARTAALTVVTGPPCSGKTSWIAARRRPGDVVVDADALAVALGASGSHVCSRAQQAAARLARAAVIGHVLREGGWAARWDAGVYVIHTTLARADTARYSEAGARVVLLDPGRAECRRRASADGRPRFTYAAIDSWYASPSDLGGLIHGDESRSVVAATRRW